ncbi:MAG: SDR family NAD(P)-dependent oxidoreductase, partial [Oscillospiraceae bacterium]
MEREVNGITIPSFDLTGKVAIVTGGTKGIGRGIAIVLAAYGASVAVSARTEADCAKMVAELEGMGAKAMGVPADVTKDEDM